jgi:hypothetical protein
VLSLIWYVGLGIRKVMIGSFSGSGSGSGRVQSRESRESREGGGARSATVVPGRKSTYEWRIMLCFGRWRHQMQLQLQLQMQIQVEVEVEVEVEVGQI